MDENFATKSDLRETETRLASKIESVTTRLESALREVEYKLTIRLGTICTTVVTLGIAATATLVKLIH